MKNKFLTISIPILILICALFYFTYQFVQPSPKKEITIATGSKDGQYYKTAIEYKKLLEQEKVKVNIITSSGSIENIKLLKDKKVDIAFIQNGTINDDKNFSALASIYFEPLWLFYKKDLNINYIQDLKDKKISIGEVGSGTKDLAQKLLEINGINQNNIITENSTKSKEMLLNGQIDAMFLVTSAKSKLVKELLSNENIELFSQRRAIAYAKEFYYLNNITLYEGTVSLIENIPNKNIELLATTATLISNNDFSEELTRILLKKVKEYHHKKSLFSDENQFPNLKNINIPIHEEARRYFEHGDTFLEKIFPFWIASNLDRLKILLIPLLTLMFPLFKGIFPLYRWSVRSKIYKWYDEVQELDLSLDNLGKEELEKKLIDLENLKKEIKEETKVPLPYMGEYYDLIMHLELIISKVNNKIKLSS